MSVFRSHPRRPLDGDRDKVARDGVSVFSSTPVARLIEIDVARDGVSVVLAPPRRPLDGLIDVARDGVSVFSSTPVAQFV